MCGSLRALRALRKEWHGLVGAMKGSTLPSTQRTDESGMVGGSLPSSGHCYSVSLSTL